MVGEDDRPACQERMQFLPVLENGRWSHGNSEEGNVGLWQKLKATPNEYQTGISLGKREPDSKMHIWQG